MSESNPKNKDRTQSERGLIITFELYTEPGIGSAPPGLAMLMNCFNRAECSS